MNKLFFLLAFVVFAAGCKDRGYKKMKDGTEYKIVRGGGGTAIKEGNDVKAVIRQFYNDSALNNGMDTMPQMITIDSLRMKEYTALFTDARKGDSIITRISTDSIIKYGAPPFIKKGKYIYTRIFIAEVYSDTAVSMKERTKMISEAMRADSLRKIQQVVKDDELLSQYLHKNNVTNAVKTAKGVYVVITNPGTGPLVDTGKAVSVLYKGTNLQGQTFDQSYDETGKPTKPYTFVVGKGGSIEGMDDAIRLFRKGAKGKMYVPSVLAYGTNARSAEIKANENLIFDIEVVSVKDGKEYMKEQQMLQQMQMQQQMQQQQQQQPQQP